MPGEGGCRVAKTPQTQTKTHTHTHTNTHTSPSQTTSRHNQHMNNNVATVDSGTHPSPSVSAHSNARLLSSRVKGFAPDFSVRLSQSSRDAWPKKPTRCVMQVWETTWSGWPLSLISVARDREPGTACACVLCADDAHLACSFCVQRGPVRLQHAIGFGNG